MLTIANIDRCQESQKTIVTIDFTTLGLCKAQNFIKIGRFTVSGPKLWSQRWQVSISTSANIDRRQESKKFVNIEYRAFDFCTKNI